ncbi:ATP-grasp domain-containing protein [Streptomyces sp. NBC_00893]|uniref:ATP-grasp domain-containing protein n=1 Tax=Streptomyces sp. NBC_00893 TaxID=2975862 RepID=UPI0022556811|nr:ATP-grasp domain-containing protein [Streptomyces sp. NBC_00893]MCX4850522.1 ATP-grasp domain-containing protein [Streptomyces sp. NBC_00893]
MSTSAPGPDAPRILLLGGTAESARKAAECGLSVVNVDKPALFEPAAKEHCAQTHLIDYQDIGLVTVLAGALHQHAPFTRVLSQTEAGPLVAGHLTTALGLAGNGVDVTRVLHDKLALRGLLNTRGLGRVAVRRGTTFEALRDFVAHHGGAVVKPTMGSGSLAVRKVRSPGEAAEAWDWLASFGVRDFMVEELLVGPELSVESFSVAGRHSVLAITGKDNGDGVVALGHVVPAELSRDEASAIAALTCRMLDAVGLVEGPAHTEVILTADGPRVVESHNRCAGGHINELVAMVHGVDLERLTYRLALPGPVTVPAPAADGAAAVRFLTPPAGRVESVGGVDEARAADGVVRVEVKAEPGQDVRPLRWSEDRSGVVVVRAENSAAAARRARQVAESIEIRTRPSEQEPPTTMGDLLAAADEVLDPFAQDPYAQGRFTQQEGPHACAPLSSTPPTTYG